MAPAANADLDFLLEQVAATLQLTQTQFQRAETAYGSVTDWLGTEGSPLARFEPRLFPQGSAALLTTTKPVHRNDYDVDVVCQLLPTGWGAVDLYQAVWDRLAAHGVYRPMLEAKPRCIRLNYEAEFHLDIVPAEPWPLIGSRHGELALRIPDRQIADWTPSNPRGYALWFHEQAETARLLREAREVAPLPSHVTQARNTVLATVVQLVKRYRDLKFATPAPGDLTPRSIILTTLAAHVYDGEQSTARALYTVITGIADLVRAAWPNCLVVANPTNPHERFCDKFTPESYAAFVEFVLNLEAEVIALARQHGGLQDHKPRLDALFGSEPVQRALTEYGNLRRSATNDGRLRASSTAGVFIADAATSSNTKADSRVVPPHRFYGADSTRSAGEQGE